MDIQLKDFYTAFGQTWAVIATTDNNEYLYRVIQDKNGEDVYISNLSVRDMILDDDDCADIEITGAYELDTITTYYAADEDFYLLDDESMRDMVAEEVPDLFS